MKKYFNGILNSWFVLSSKYTKWKCPTNKSDFIVYVSDILAVMYPMARVSLARTQDTMMTCFSRPWKPSTVDTSIPSRLLKHYRHNPYLRNECIYIPLKMGIWYTRELMNWH